MEKEWIKLLKNGDALLENIPEAERRAAVCLAAVQYAANRLEYVPESLKTPEICLAAVQNNGSALQYVPENLKTSALCLAAVQSYDYALTYVPRKLRTPEMFLAAGMILCGANYTNTKEDSKLVLMYRFLCEKDNRKLKVAIYAKSISEALINLAYGDYTVLKSLGAATL